MDNSIGRLVNYEAHVFDLTAKCQYVHKEDRGTFHGIDTFIINHLKSMGVNCIQLMPVFNCLETHWGYDPISWTELNPKYGTLNEFKQMVDRLHAAGIKVVLDVVYNHTAQPIKDVSYGEVGFSGCGGDVLVDKSMEVVKESIDFWMSIVDGMRFDLAPILFRENNKFKPDGIFSKYLKTHSDNGKIIIVEPWDCGGYSGYESYFVDQFPDWCIEINDNISHAVRQGGTYYCGKNYKKYMGFITSHDGFTLQDLVSYNNKHNERNGENNRDGNDNNISNNHGFEGPTDNQWIIDARGQTKRRMIENLKVSSYHIMLLMGDEMGRTQGGCNNDYLIGTPLIWE